MSQILQHKHVIFRIETKNTPHDPTFLKNWMEKLVANIGMELYAGPIVKYLDEPGNRGLTGVCIIKTSHIAIHIWDEPDPGLVQLDVYTCGALEVEDVVKEFQCFHPVKVEYKMLDREHGLELLSEGSL